MRIATWNINDVHKRLPLLLSWLQAFEPDVVALQELKTTSAAFPRQALADAGYGSLAVGQRTWNGVALLARGTEPVPVGLSLPGDEADRQARYVEAAVAGIVFVGLYLPNGNPYPGPKFDYKMAWFERLLRRAAELHRSGHPVVLLGDFNVVPAETDIYASTSWHDNALVQPQPRDAFRRLLRQGWTDAIRAVHPDDVVYTFWDYRRNRWARNAGLRIDHILLSRSMTSRLVDAGVHRELRGVENASDHAAVWVELR